MFNIEKYYGQKQELLVEARGELEQFKSNIISNISHEFRTPNTIAYCAIELALDNEDIEFKDQMLKRAKKALIKQDRILENLLKIAVLQHGLNLDLKEINLGELLRLTADEMRPNAEDKRIKFEVEITDIHIIADFNELRHVLVNLLDNAIKFTEKEGYIKISVKIGAGGMAEILVEDTGIGIPDEYNDRIFDRFYQVDASTTRKFGGMGMGLAVAKGIIDAHGGSIWFKKRPRGGSCFYVSLHTKKSLIYERHRKL